MKAEHDSISFAALGWGYAISGRRREPLQVFEELKVDHLRGDSRYEELLKQMKLE